MNLEGLARLGTNPLAIDVGLLNEEGWIFQLIPVLFSRSHSLFPPGTNLGLAVSHGVQSLQRRRRRNGKRVASARTQQLARDWADKSLHYKVTREGEQEGKKFRTRSRYAEIGEMCGELRTSLKGAFLREGLAMKALIQQIRLL